MFWLISCWEGVLNVGLSGWEDEAKLKCLILNGEMHWVYNLWPSLKCHGQWIVGNVSLNVGLGGWRR